MEIDLTNEELTSLRDFLASHKEEMAEKGLTPIYWKLHLEEDN